MIRNRFLLGLLLLLFLSSCDKKWEEHYNDVPETVDRNIWEVIKETDRYSEFAKLIESYEYDTLFEGNDVYTLYIPGDDAMLDYMTRAVPDARLLDYLFSLHFIQSRNINGLERVQTMSEKFADFENAGTALFFDEIEILDESPLYRNGKIFELSAVAEPLPNLFEYYEVHNDILSEYIESLDSVILDKELSRPLGYDENGNTIYDTVAEIYNEFEDEYFPVREEFRYKAATMVFPDKDEYNAALDEMAGFLGGDYNTHEDIPLEWQYDNLIPYLLYNGVFDNRVEQEEFTPPPYPRRLKMKNILGDSIYVEYYPTNQARCSNGYAYDYASFSIPDTLYRSPQRLEGEALLQQVGSDRFAWEDDVIMESSISLEPERRLAVGLSNDSMLYVPFPADYEGQFDLEFNFPNLFPGNFLMVIRTNIWNGGQYDIEVNGDFVYSMDWYDFTTYQGVWFGVNGDVYRPDGPMNSFDCFVTKTNEYGNTKVKFIYKGPGKVSANGFVIDYFDFLPLEN